MSWNGGPDVPLSGLPVSGAGRVSGGVVRRSLNAADAATLLFSVTTQIPEPEHVPPQPVKTAPAPAIGASVTAVPSS